MGLSIAPPLSNGAMHYRPAILGAELHHTTLAVAWKAADIYALEPASVDAIAEAGADLSLSPMCRMGVDIAPNLPVRAGIVRGDVRCMRARHAHGCQSSAVNVDPPPTDVRATVVASSRRRGGRREL